MSTIGLYYYSYEGFTDRVMQALEAELTTRVDKSIGVYRERLVPIDEKRRTGLAKYFWGGREALMGKRPRLEPIERAPEPNSIVVIAGPVWSFTYPPPVGSFIDGYDLSRDRIALLLTHDGGPRKAMEKLRDAVGLEHVFATALMRNEKQQETVDTTALNEMIDAIVAESAARGAGT